MSSRHSGTLAVYGILEVDHRVATLRRFQTGWADGWLTLPAGHIEAGEGAFEAGARELLEELGIRVTRFGPPGIMHRASPEDTRVDIFLPVLDWEGEPRNAEPHKASELVWVPRAAPPADLLPYQRRALAETALLLPWYLEHGLDGHPGDGVIGAPPIAA